MFSQKTDPETMLRVELGLVQVGVTPLAGAVTDAVVKCSHSLEFCCQRCRLGNKQCSGCHVSSSAASKGISLLKSLGHRESVPLQVQADYRGVKERQLAGRFALCHGSQQQ